MAESSPTVGIVGLGSIGGSLAQALVKVGWKVSAFTRSDIARSAASAAGISLVGAERDLLECDLVVVCVPLSATESTFELLASAFEVGPSAPTITDVGSVKAEVLEAARRSFGDLSCFVGGHPMAGTAQSGWGAAKADLFAGSNWAICLDEPTQLERAASVMKMAIAAGSQVVPAFAGEHDLAVAAISHLPYALGATVAQIANDQGSLALSLAAGSYSDLTRVVSQDASLGTEITTANRAALAPLLRSTARRLDSMAERLENAGSLGDEFEDAHLTALRRRAIKDATFLHSGVMEVADLVSLGRRGGRIFGVTGSQGVGLEIDWVEP